MQTTSALIKKPKKIRFDNQDAVLYSFKPIKARHSHDDCEPTIEYSAPKAIVVRKYSNSFYVYFNNNHPNVNEGIIKYGREYYAAFCLGTLYDEIKPFLDHKKFPEILYNTLAEYSGGGYWYPDNDIDNTILNQICVVCKRITTTSDFDEKYCGCTIVDKEGYELEFDACVTKKFSWSKKHNSFIYKGRIHDDYR